MKVSIVTPVYNDPRIKHCINSINNQVTDAKIEHIVVDGGSTDETVEIIAKNRENIDIYICEEDNGIYDAMNKGVAQASGEIVGVLNADDRYSDGQVLADVIKFIQSEDLDVCYGDLLYVNNQEKPIRYWESGSYSPYKFYFGWVPPHPTFFVRREMYEKYGYFDISFDIAADYEFMFRLLMKNNVSVGYLDRVLVRMAYGGKSNESIGNMMRAIPEVYRAWEKHNLRGKYIAPLLHPIEKIPQYVKALYEHRN